MSLTTSRQNLKLKDSKLDILKSVNQSHVTFCKGQFHKIFVLWDNFENIFKQGFNFHKTVVRFHKIWGRSTHKVHLHNSLRLYTGMRYVTLDQQRDVVIVQGGAVNRGLKRFFSLNRPSCHIEAYIRPEKYWLVWAGPLANHHSILTSFFLATAERQRRKERYVLRIYTAAFRSYSAVTDGSRAAKLA
jgi:hypothetical protein